MAVGGQKQVLVTVRVRRYVYGPSMQAMNGCVETVRLAPRDMPQSAVALV